MSSTSFPSELQSVCWHKKKRINYFNEHIIIATRNLQNFKRQKSQIERNRITLEAPLPVAVRILCRFVHVELLLVL